MLPTCKRISKVRSRAQGFINLSMACRLIAIIKSNRLDPRGDRLKPLDDCSAHLFRRLSLNLGHHCKTAFSLNQGEDGTLLRSANVGVALPMPDMGALFNRLGPLKNRAPVRDLTAAIMATGIALTMLFLAAQGAP